MSSPAVPDHAQGRARRLALVAVGALVALLGGVTAPASADYVLIEGDGSTWSRVIVNQWVADVSANGIQVVYSGGGSSLGRKNFAHYQDDFAITEIPYQGTDEFGAPDTSLGRPYAYVPIVAGGTAFSYHVEVGGKLMRDVRLSGATIAKVFTNQIVNWSDPAIAADNNGRLFPNLPIVPVVRADPSGTTAQLTGWLNSQFPAIWQPYFGKAGQSTYYPTKSGARMLSAAGSDQLMNTISSSAGNGTIGYVEYSYALNKDYPVVKLLNAAGYFVEPSALNVAVALTKAKIDDDDATSPGYMTAILDDVYTNPDPRAYPLSSYSYLILPTGPSGSGAGQDSRMTTLKRQSLLDLMFYGLCEGQAKAMDYGYSPLPLNLVQAGFEQLGKLKTADANVDIQNRDATKCNNPTFVAGDLNANHLADIAPMPATCDAAGFGPCLSAGQDGTGIDTGGGIRMTLGVPSAPVTPAGLVLAVPTDAGISLTGQRDPGNTRVTASAAVPTITVVDTRTDDLITSWQVHAQAQAFTGGTGIVDAKYLGWTPEIHQVVAETGGLLAARAGSAVPSFLNDMASSGLSVGQVLGGTTSSGRGTTTLGAVLDLAIPSNTAQGSYTSTLTITLVAG
ncbi:substrate-binding domain-containing protein [Pengzhenrongella frigida]|uniref:Phosphate ABC transporter substrate-binding protein n=1 Tax=Pengzhenrongella frigida TaxID=1259133 RepID=A0A4Q5N341_9MICO|nr:substrate-binding domain-containing protein [Cellulomonas sp. HLT2-17]RYV52590.1 phosphate ABC transporter substrate-binding protein [Cellulomonas sp. HLT2-17]